MDRLERLVNLVAALRDAARPLTREEIRERIPGAYADDDEAYKRTFERDKDTLRQLGMTLTVEALDKDNADSAIGYRVRREDYELPDPGLGPDELAALHLAASAVRVEGVAGTEAIWKLGGAPVPAAGAVANVPGSEHLATLFGAIADCRTVTFDYRGQTRTVDPWFLSFRRGAWYLIGRDHTRDDRRTFRVDRVEGASRVGAARAFERPGDLVRTLPPPWEMGDEEPVDVTFVVDAPFAEQVVAHVGAAAVVASEAMHTTFRVRVSNRPAFRSFALELLDHAEVVDPPEVRDDLIAWLEALAATG